ncbi:MAG: hypothetical protein KY444_12585, partial [Gemmatimonadetes bacterium]|nr:hypothetical protein [Gemmatimonadota bacterium]
MAQACPADLITRISYKTLSSTKRIFAASVGALILVVSGDAFVLIRLPTFCAGRGPHPPLDGARLMAAPPAAPTPPIRNAADLARFIATRPALLEPLRAVAALG